MKLYNGKTLEELEILYTRAGFKSEFSIDSLGQFLSIWAPEHKVGVQAIAEACTPRCNWSKELPIEIGLWWWWNEDEDSLPLVVDIAYSATDQIFFAMEGQHGWNRFQPATEMKGYWMRLHEPEPPK